jgi:hypothetical protein
MPASEPDPPAPAAGLPAPAVQPEAPEVMPPTPAVQPAEPSDLAAEESAYLARMTLIQAGKHGRRRRVHTRPSRRPCRPIPMRAKRAQRLLSQKVLRSRQQGPLTLIAGRLGGARAHQGRGCSLTMESLGQACLLG